MYEAATRSYRQMNVLSADPLKLIHLCYEGAISSLKRAKEAYASQDFPAKGKALTKALDIIHELNASLDLKRGGDVAKNLRGLYLFMTHALIKADVDRDLKVFDEVIQMLEELKTAWQEVAGCVCRNADGQPLPVMPKAGGQRVAVSRAWSV